jgi:hypothetical protein
VLRAYSKAKLNPIMPKDIIANMFLNVEVCGWEVPSDPLNKFDNLIPAERTLFIEKASTRT